MPAIMFVAGPVSEACAIDWTGRYLYSVYISIISFIKLYGRDLFNSLFQNYMILVV